MKGICPTCGNHISDPDKQKRCPRCHTLLKENPKCEDCKTGCEISLKLVIED